MVFYRFGGPSDTYTRFESSPPYGGSSTCFDFHDTGLFSHHTHGQILFLVLWFLLGCIVFQPEFQA